MVVFFPLGECLTKILDMFPKDLFLYLHKHSDERRQGDLVNLWYRLSNTERGILTARQVASVLMRLLDIELVKKVIAEYQASPNSLGVATAKDGCPVSREWLLEVHQGDNEGLSPQKQLEMEAQIEADAQALKGEKLKWNKAKALEIYSRLENPASAAMPTSCFARFSLGNHVKAFRKGKAEDAAAAVAAQ